MLKTLLRFLVLRRLAAIVILVAAPSVHAASSPLQSPPAAPSGAAVLDEPIDRTQPNTTLVAAAIFHATNRLRREQGLPKFHWHEKIDRAADLQASSSMLTQTAGHLHHLPGLTTLANRMRHVGLKPRLAGENVALVPLLAFNPSHNYYRDSSGGEAILRDRTTDRPIEPHTYATLAATVVESWMQSPVHRANLMNPRFEYLGCGARVGRSISGLETVACVQVFFTPRSRRL